MRRLYPLFVMLAGAFSFVYSFKKRWTKNWFGWFDMPHAWKKWGDDPSFHHFKNLGDEWVKLDSKRTYKMGSFLIVFHFILGLLLGLCL